MRWRDRLQRREQLQVALGDIRCTAFRDEARVLQEDRPVAELAHAVHVVSDEDDGRACTLELPEVFEALALERGVADRQHLVDEQDVGPRVRRDRERDAHVHAR